MSKIEIKQINIIDLDVECIVNAANTALQQGGGVCGAIFKAAGAKELQEACNKLEHCNTGHAVITPGFGLKQKYIIHAVGPIWHGGSYGEPEQLYSAYKSALELAEKNGIKTIGFPLISSGIYGYPLEKAWEVAIKALKEFMVSDPDIDVTFAVLSEDVQKAGLDEMEKNIGFN